MGRTVSADAARPCCVSPSLLASGAGIGLV